MKISQMHQEIQELTWQRDQAESHLQSLLESFGIKDQVFRMDGHSAPGSSEMINAFCLDADLPGTKTFKDFDYPGAVSPNKQIIQIPEDNFLLDGSTPKFSGPGWEDIGKRNSEDAKDICEEVPGTIMVESRRKVKKVADVLFPVLEEKIPMHEGEVPSSQEEDKELIHINSNNTHETVKQKIQELHETIDHLERSPSFSDAVESSYKNLKWTRSKSRRSVLMTIPYALWSEKEEDNGRVSPTASEKDFPERSEDLKQKLLELEHDVKLGNKSQEDSQNPLYGASAEEDVIKDIDVDVEDTTSVLDFVAGVNKMAAKLHSENLSRDMQVRR
jgi:centromeric protein E